MTTAPAPVAVIAPWQRRLPNVITVARLVLAGLFFAMLSVYEFGTTAMNWWLFAAGWVYGLAAATDAVDGHRARKWQVTSVFGRVVDPFCDKILVLGSFVYFAGPAFQTVEGGEVASLTGVPAAVVVILLGRELLVTTLRGMAEAAGQTMGAKSAGKAKMIFQSTAIPMVILYVLVRGWVGTGHPLEVALRVLREVAVWGTVAVTLWSMWPYVKGFLPEKSA